MKGHLRLDHIEGSHDVAHAQLSLLQQLDDPEPRLVRKSLENSDQFLHG
jgi:hypothetical protein